MNYNKRFNQYSKILKLIAKNTNSSSSQAREEIKSKAINILIPFK